MNILANPASPIHLNGLALQFWELELNGTTGIISGNLKDESKLIPNQLMGVGAGAMPLSALLVGLYLEPIVIAVLVGLYVGYQCLVLLL